MTSSKYAPTLGDRLVEVIQTVGRPMHARELSILTKESPRAIGRALGNLITNGKIRIAEYDKRTRLAIYDLGRDRRAQEQIEPEQPITVTEIAPGRTGASSSDLAGSQAAVKAAAKSSGPCKAG